MEACDTCGPAVRAITFVVVNGTELGYCGHHASLYFDAWIERGYKVIVDLRETK